MAGRQFIIHRRISTPEFQPTGLRFIPLILVDGLSSFFRLLIYQWIKDVWLISQLYHSYYAFVQLLHVVCLLLYFDGIFHAHDASSQPRLASLCKSGPRPAAIWNLAGKSSAAL